MSEELIKANAARNSIVDWQTRETGYPSTGHIVRLVGELASLDPSAAVMVAENVTDPVDRINALVKAGDVAKDVGPILDALAIAQSEIVPEPRRGRKLEFIAYHALATEDDSALAIEIARSIESPGPRARVLLSVAIREEGAGLLEEVDGLSAKHKLGYNFDNRIQHVGRKTQQYRVGLNACQRESARRMRSTDFNLSEEETQLYNTQYVLDCVADSLEADGDCLKLIPIADGVAEALLAQAELDKRQLDGEHVYYTGYGFSISHVSKLALIFAEPAPEASKALYKVIKKMADNKIKAVSKQVAKKRATAAKRPSSVNHDVAEPNDDPDDLFKLFERDLGLLDDPEFEL